MHERTPQQIKIGANCSIAALSKLFGKSIPLVKKLSLAHSALTDEQLDAVAASCPLLEALVIDNCQQVTTLPSGLQQLYHFSCALCYKIGDTTLRKFATSCQNLNSINLFFCQNITDAGLVNLSGTHTDNLSILDLTSCNKVPLYLVAVLEPPAMFISLIFLAPLCKTRLAMVARTQMTDQVFIWGSAAHAF